MQFNTEATSIAFLHHHTNCSGRQAAASVTTASDAGAAVVQLVTVNLDGSQIWALPLDEVKSFDFGRWGRLLVSTSQGLYEADVTKQGLQKLTPPATGMPLLHCP